MVLFLPGSLYFTSLLLYWGLFPPCGILQNYVRRLYFTFWESTSNPSNMGAIVLKNQDGELVTIWPSTCSTLQFRQWQALILIFMELVVNQTQATLTLWSRGYLLGLLNGYLSNGNSPLIWQRLKAESTLSPDWVINTILSPNKILSVISHYD